MQMNRSDLLLRKRNAPEQRQKRGCRGSTELPIVVPRRSWREISCGKLGTLIQQTKNSLNFVSTCLKVVDTRRTSGTSTTCSERNHASNSFVRITSLTSRSFVPSSPVWSACRDSCGCIWTRVSHTGRYCCLLLKTERLPPYLFPSACKSHYRTRPAYLHRSIHQWRRARL